MKINTKSILLRAFLLLSLLSISQIGLSVCTLTASITSYKNPTCKGFSNGKATVTASGGTLPYTYSWSPSGGTNVTATNLSAGTYIVTVTDSNGCIAKDSITLTQPTQMVEKVYNIKGISCFGYNTGSATVCETGGIEPYTYTWSPMGANGPLLSNLSAGTYTCTVMDNNGCVTTASVTITQPPLLTLSATSITDEYCYGDKSGSISVTASGGVLPYSYSWMPTGGTNSSVTGLSAGSYTCTLTDKNGCVSTVSANITQPCQMKTAISSITPATCGNSNGSAAITVLSGCNPPYTYSWSPFVSTSSSASNLSAGTYTATVTNSNGCKSSQVMVVNSSGPTAVITLSTHVSCYGGTDGSANVTASGGTPPYTYLWSPSGQTNTNASNLSAGRYWCQVSDNSSCVGTDSVTITQPPALTATEKHTIAKDCSSSDGMAIVSVSGGTTPYTYSWSPSGGNKDTATGLNPGIYTCLITDAHGCSKSINDTVFTKYALSTKQTNVTCNGGNDGTATVYVTSGSSPYTYSWSPSGGSSASATGLSAGTYTVTVNDANGCALKDSVTLTQSPPITDSTSTVIAASCGNSNGSAVVTAKGGSCPCYSYLWSPIGGTTNAASDLSAGTYTCTVTDANGCSGTIAVVVPDTGITVSVISHTNETCYGDSNGKATVSVSGGTNPYTYNWIPKGGAGTTATNLTAGTYSCTVTDSGGCVGVGTVTITQPAVLSANMCYIKQVSCYGGTDACAGACVSGGRKPYYYSWSPLGGNGDTACGLSAGTYILNITDSTLTCSTTVSVVITQPSQLTVITDSSIGGGCNNSAWGNVSGGTKPYSYSWSNSQTSDTATNLCSGTYTITVTDGNGCSFSATVTIPVVTGIVQANQQSGITVFPNPTNTVLNIATYKNNEAIKEIIIHDLTGRVVMKENLIPKGQANPLRVDVSSLDEGIYLMQMITDKGTKTARFAIVR